MDRRHRQQVMKQLDITQDKIGVSEPQNVNLLPFQDISRANQRKRFEQAIFQENHDLELKKKQLKAQEAQKKHEEKEQQLKYNMLSREIEQKEKLKKRIENQSVLDYWREQENNKTHMKQWEKDADNKDGEKYIKWVNEFSDKINGERLKIYETNERKTMNKSFRGGPNQVSPTKNPLGDLGSREKERSLSPAGYQNYGTSKGSSKDLNQHDSQGSLVPNGSNFRIQQRHQSEFMDKDKLREKFKSDYVQYLNQQILEKRMRKEQERQMDPRDKELNKKYIEALREKKEINHNPILSGVATGNLAVLRNVSMVP